METITLYHGTTKENADAIKADGFIAAPAYFTPRKDIAEAYAFDNDPEGFIFSVELPISALNIDHENWMDDDINEAIENGISVYMNTDVTI